MTFGDYTGGLKNTSGMFDYKPNSMPGGFGFDSQVKSLTGSKYSDFDIGQNIFSPKKKESGNFLTRYIDKMPKLGKDEEGRSFLDRFQSYRPKEETGQEKFYGELAKRMGTGSSGMAAPVAEGLTLTQNETGSPTVVGGTPGQPGLLQTVGVPLVGAFLCDIRLKEDISPLCKSEVNDVLSECAYFVKNLNECS